MRFLVITLRRSLEAGDFAGAEANLGRMFELCRLMHREGTALNMLVDMSLAAMEMDSVVAVASRLPPDDGTMARLRLLLPPSLAIDTDAVSRMFLCPLILSLAKAPEDGDRWVQDLQSMHLNAALLRMQMSDVKACFRPQCDLRPQRRDQGPGSSGHGCADPFASA